MPSTRIDSAMGEKISRIVGGIQSLPTPPIVFTQIQKILNNPDTSAYDVATILQEDAAMSAKVLKLTNSAYYGLSRTIEAVKQAVVIVGLEAVKNLVLSASVFDMFAAKGIDREAQDYFWRHSLAAAFGARLLARQLDSKISFHPEAGFSAGLLHDIGKMVISVYMAEERRKIMQAKAEKPTIPDHAVEGEALGYNHSQVGAFLADHWQLPPKLVEAIEFHHFPQAAPSSENSLPYLIHLANYLAKLTFDVGTNKGNSYLEPLQKEALDTIGVAEQDIMAFVNPLREEYLKAETFIAMARGLG